MFGRRTARAWLLAYVVVSLVNIASGLLEATVVNVGTKALLMPLLL
ncbi:MAG: hypothetical protein H6528_13830, partial [Actinobacteria bacterium]|nr:hypothetical protein [Actinomycetota bacterium]